MIKDQSEIPAAGRDRQKPHPRPLLRKRAPALPASTNISIDYASCTEEFEKHGLGSCFLFRPLPGITDNQYKKNDLYNSANCNVLPFASTSATYRAMSALSTNET